MKIKLLGLVFLFSVLTLALIACGGKDQIQDRGRYIYDEAGILPVESEISLASYLWKLDSKTSYEVVLVFPKEMMDEDAIGIWFDKYGVGKKDIDNGAAIFVFPDSSVFVAIGSGNDKVSVTESKTYGERIFRDFKDDPVLTLLRFTSVLGGKVDESSDKEIGGNLFENLKDNLNLILLWAAVVALFFFLIQQFDGFQPRDLILPIVVFVVLGIFFGFSALGSNASTNTYKSYGVITATKHSTYEWVEMRTVVVSNGKTTTTYVVPIPHTDYINDVQFLSYEFKKYQYRFKTTDSKGAWNHQVGDLNSLTLKIDNGILLGTSGVDDRSGGKTIGDGVWILSGKK